MNFLKIILKSGHIFLGFIYFFVLPVYSNNSISLTESGIPLIQKFSFPNFCLSSGKFSVYEDSSGIFLIGAKDKIILFYGNEFMSIKMKGQITVSSDQKSIFYTGFNSLGLIKLYKYSLPQLIPIVDNDNLKNSISFGQINNVYVSEGLIIFNNDNKLFQFDGSNFMLVDSSAIKLQLFRVNNDVIVYKFESGLYKFSMGKLIPIANGDKITKKNIESILPYGNALLIKCEENASFLRLDNNGIELLKFGFETFLEKAGFSDAIYIQGNNLAIGTKSAGVFIYNYDSHTIRTISVDKGLLDNTVNNLHRDKAGNLWVLHDKGISRIELNLPITVYSYFAGIFGNVNDIVKFNNILYLATSNGLLKAGVVNNSYVGTFSQLYFSRVEGIVNECIKLQVDGRNFFIITPTGIYKLENDRAKLIFKDDINCIVKTPVDNGTYYIGNESGLTVIKYSEGNFEVKNKLAFEGYAIIEISIDSENNVWIKTACNKLIMLSDDKNYFTSHKNYLIFGAADGLPAETVNFHLLYTPKGMRFCYPDSILSYNNLSNRFENVEVTDLKYLNGIPWLVEALIDRFGNKWYYISSSVEHLQGVLMYKVSLNKNIEKPVFFNTGTILSPIYVDSANVFIGGENKLLQFNNGKPFNLPRNFSAIIKRVIIAKDSVLLIKLEDPEINFKYNTLKFEVSSTCFEGEPYIRYQYKLDGYNKKWSNWTRESIFSFNNLSPGKYNFIIKALNVDGTVSGETNFKFYILHPFYLTLPAYVFYLIVFLIILFVALRWRIWISFRSKEKLEKIVFERTEEILKEKEKSEQLIANLLPKGTADELKLTGKVTSHKFTMVTVLFSDIQGFTKIAEHMNPELLIDQLDAFFFQFDMVVEKYNIEKIKTIGDAYMCAGGIPNKNITNPVEVILAALEMLEYMRELKSKNIDIWDLRIGIHTGSVIAGVVGHKKMSYDIWGDTVNTASRMESSGEAGKINISGHTYDLVKDFFVCEYRGKMPVKYKGDIDMYFVESIKPEFAENVKYLPNKRFFIMLQLMRIQDLEEYVFEKLSAELPKDLYFHNIAHTRDVYNLVDLFGRAEKLTDEENLMLRTAAILHDVGYTWSYDNHEELSINYAQEILIKYKYSQEQIEFIVELIEATKQMRKPKNKIEEILLDADMNYISRADFITLNNLYFKELYEKKKVASKEEWDRMQIVLLSNYKFYSNVANVLRDISSEQQIQNILEASKKTDKL